MNYPWISNFLFEAVDSEDQTDIPTTDDPVDVLSPNIIPKKKQDTSDENTSDEDTSKQDTTSEDTVDEDKPDQDTTDQDVTEQDTTDDKDLETDENTTDEVAPENTSKENTESDTDEADFKSKDETDKLKQEISDLKEQLDEIKKNFDMEDEVKKIKMRLDNLDIQDSTNLNDSLFQIACKDIKIIKRAVRRCYAKISNLNSEQQNKIINEIKANPRLSYQEISKKLSGVIGARQLDIFDFLMNTDYEYRHRHTRYI